MNNVDKIRNVCHKVLANTNLFPKEGKTFCNIGTYYILDELGYGHYFFDTQAKMPKLANEMNLTLKRHFKKLELNNLSSDYLESGNIFIASIYNAPHGHIAIIYPTKTKVFSFKWNTSVPLCANIGKENGIIGLNYAFDEKPDIFLIGKPL